ncbi:MAG: hypothetical protein ACLR4Z_08110 [Butyricicoccaceae bacterium]
MARRTPVECICRDDVNYIKMRSLAQAGFNVVYDAVRQMPSITAPQCRTFVPDGTAEGAGSYRHRAGVRRSGRADHRLPAAVSVRRGAHQKIAAHIKYRYKRKPRCSI